VQRVIDDARPAPATPPASRRLGVALGGGSARGYAHIGVLAALERRAVTPAVIVGTSFGAVVGALYATGRSAEELRREAERLRRRDVLPHVLDVGFAQGALVAGQRLEDYFDRLLEGRRFEDLPRTLGVVATDLDSGERIVLRSGPLAPALRASTSLPGVFAPARVGGRRLIDGGIGTPVPLDTLAGFAVDVALGIGVGVEHERSHAVRTVRRVLATRVGRAFRGRLAGGGAGAVGGLSRALALTADGWCGSRSTCPGLHVQTRPPISWLRFDRAGVAIAAGDAAMEGAWPALRGALGLDPAPL
jgi:predicted acylesterase/phospholipase RssA